MHRTISLVFVSLLAACQPQNQEAPASHAPLPLWPGATVSEASLPLADANGMLWLAQAGASGISLRDGNGTAQDTATGRFGPLAVLPATLGHGTTYIAAVAEDRPHVVLWSVNPRAPSLALKLDLPVTARVVETLCFYRSAQNDALSLFLLDDRGSGEQWLLAQGEQWLDKPLPLRTLNLPYDVSSCAADHATGHLYVAESGIGIWRLGAEPESMPDRSPVALVTPEGYAPSELAPLTGEITVLAVDDSHGLWAATDGDTTQLVRFPHASRDEQPAAEAESRTLTPGEVSSLGFERNADQAELAIALEGGDVYRLTVDVPAGTQVTQQARIPEVAARAETTPSLMNGDVMDDPAIWIHPQQPEHSRVLGTDKRHGLEVYDLQGQRLQQLAVGRLNNVDVRYGLSLGSRKVDLAAASQRDRNSIALFTISAEGVVTAAGEIPTGLNDIYGLCQYQPEGSDEHYVFANGKDGRFEQYRLSAQDSSRISAEKVREFQFASQPEGCVADDRRHRLFVGEEDEGVWVVDARADQPAQPERVASVGEHLVADVEGLAIAQGEQPLLVVSSQGNDSYVIFDAQPPYAWRGSFRVGVNATAAIDGSSETDGLEVTSAALGADFPAGLLVVQDGRNLAATGQNFKLVSWADVLTALQLPLP